MEARKIKEQEFHNFVRSDTLKQDQKQYRHFTSNKKYYSVVRKSQEFVRGWLAERILGKRVLDYCCGNGDMNNLVSTFWLAENRAAEVVGIDISDQSIESARKLIPLRRNGDRCSFITMDAESLKFEDNSFDVLYEGGVLHHLDLNRAYPEIARVLKPNGTALCVEALGHNPFIHAYRKLTPHLRTEWEADHILKKPQVDLARKFFAKVELLGFFHLLSLGAVPLRKTPLFRPALTCLEAIDGVFLRLPVFKWQAWQVVFSLSEPLKQNRI